MSEQCVVEVLREPDGQIYSQIRRGPVVNRTLYAVVVDRARGKGLDNETVIHRAKALADLLGIAYLEDFEWKCVRLRKLNCKCPDCVAKGRA